MQIGQRQVGLLLLVLSWKMLESSIQQGNRFEKYWIIALDSSQTFFFQLSLWIRSDADLQVQPFKTEVTLKSVEQVFRTRGLGNKVTVITDVY